MNTQQIVAGSIADLAQRNNQTLAESFLTCDCVVLVDVSGSMGECDRSASSRYDRACGALEDLQSSMPGKIAVISFSDEPQFEPAGVPRFARGSTNLAKALRFAKVADVPDMRFVVISDGEPNDEISALSAAKSFQNHIDVIFVGDETDRDAVAFLRKLAGVSGGRQITADAARIAESAKKLLLH